MNKADGCGVYGLGVVGALVYYYQHLVGFSLVAIVMGILKSLVWPAMVVYKLLGFLGM